MTEHANTGNHSADEGAGETEFVRFESLRHKPTRRYIGAATLGMMGDNVEHVLTYWAMWQLFQSPLLAGFAVVSHWVPHLLFSVYFGGLADRFDCRRIIQVAQGLFILASIGWGVFLVTGLLEPWICCVLLVIHGLASSIWHPAEQVMLYDVAGRKALASAVRLNATGRNFGTLLGPVVGGALLLFIGPEVGIFFNVILFLPMSILMIVTPYTGHTRDSEPTRVRMTLREGFKVIGTVRRSPILLSMIGLAAATSMFIGAALGPLMPEFAERLGAGDAGFAYTALLAANAVGAVFGGVLLEATGLIRNTVRVAILSATIYALAILIFALSGNYALSLVALVFAGFFNLIGNSTEQAIAQLSAPQDQRGRVIGLYGMSAMGMRAASGVIIGFLATLFGVQLSVAASAVALVVVALIILIYANRKRIPRGAVS